MKGGRLTFAVGESHVEFVLFESQNILSPSSTLEERIFMRLAHLIIGGMLTFLHLNVLNL